MTQQGFELLIYSVMIFSTIALLWEYRKSIKEYFSEKDVTESETVYVENGKNILNSESYRALRRNLFKDSIYTYYP